MMCAKESTYGAESAKRLTKHQRLYISFFERLSATRKLMKTISIVWCEVDKPDFLGNGLV